jgi:hypothetical protein
MSGNAKEISKEKQKRQLALGKKYGQRITIARQAREAFLQKDYINATKKYNEYLSILAQLKEIEDIYKLTPVMFDQKKEVTEMLLISHIYWEIARINEMTPRLQKVYTQALSQFVKFTANQPFQVLNAEMLRKYIKKNQKVTPQLGLLNDAYQQIFVQSKKCYVATMCFGQDHEYTNAIRSLKPVIREYRYGRKFIEYYYRYSPKLVYYSSKYPILKSIANFLTKKPLTILAKYAQKKYN